MMAGLLPSLHGIARRHSRSADEADDLVQEALVAAIEAGRTDFSCGNTRAWLAGVIRNKARMAARSAVRRRAREAGWQAAVPCDDAGAADLPDVSGLPPSLRLTAMLAWTGATRPEIGWLLGLSDTALRKRISQLRRALAGLPDARPGAAGLKGGLPFGLIRRDMIARLKQRGGFLASHDPDGHVFVVARSQKAGVRQQGCEPS